MRKARRSHGQLLLKHENTCNKHKKQCAGSMIQEKKQLTEYFGSCAECFIVSSFSGDIFQNDDRFVSSASIYIVHDKESTSTKACAVKSILVNRRARKFSSEVERLKTLFSTVGHALPHCVKIYGFLHEECMDHIIMEKMNSNLHEFIMKKENTLDYFTKLKIMRHCVNAISFLHNNGIAHRDIKSQNFLSNENATRICIGDFGSLRHNNLLTNSIQAYGGTFAWIAPERKYLMANSENFEDFHAARRSDIYSLGVVLCEIMFQALPYSNSTTQEHLMHQPFNLTLLPNVMNYQLQQALHDCLSFKPTTRPICDQIIEAIDIDLHSTCISQHNKIAHYNIYDLKHYKPMHIPKLGDWLYHVQETGQTFEQYSNTRVPILHGCITVALLDSEMSTIVDHIITFMEAFAHPMKVNVLDLSQQFKEMLSSKAVKYDASLITDFLSKQKPQQCHGMIGFTNADLYTSKLAFCFSSTNSTANVSIISLFRTRPKLMYLSCVAFCIGQTLQMRKCILYKCCMNGVNSMSEMVTRPLHLCPIDLKKYHLAYVLWCFISFVRLESFGYNEQARCSKLFEWFAQRNGLSSYLEEQKNWLMSVMEK